MKLTAPLYLSVWCLMLTLGVFFFQGAYLEDNETIVSAINYGVFGKMGPDQFFSDYLTFLLPVLHYLSAWLPDYPIFGWYKTGTLLLALMLFFYTTFSYLKHAGAGVLAGFAVSVLLVTLIYDSIIQLHCVRHAVLLAFGSIMLNRLSWEQKNKVSTVAMLLFFFSVINRMHAAALILAAFVLYDMLTGTPAKALLKKYGAMVVMALSLVGLYQLNGRFTPNIGRYIEAHFEYPILEKPHVSPLSPNSTAQDSAKYIALTHFFFTDTAQFTRDYFHSFIHLQPTFNFVFNDNNYQAILNDLQKRQQDAWPAIAVIAIALLLAVWAQGFSGAWKQMLFLACMLLIPALLLLLLTNELKERFFNPYIASVSWIMLLHALGALAAKQITLPKKFIAGMFILTIGVGIWQYRHYQPLHQHLAAEHQRFLKNAPELHQTTAGKPCLLFIGSDIPLTNHPFYRTPDTLYSHLATFDGGYLTFYSYCVERFGKLFGHYPGDYAAHTAMFRKNSHGTMAYITAERIPVVKNYFKTMYNTELEFEKVKELSFCEAALYRIYPSE